MSLMFASLLKKECSHLQFDLTESDTIKFVRHVVCKVQCNRQICAGLKFPKLHLGTRIIDEVYLNVLAMVLINL